MGHAPEIAPPLLPEQMLALAGAGGFAPDYSPLSGQPFLVLDYRPGLSASDSEALACWIKRLACPALALAGPGVRADLVDACDLRLTSHDALAPLLRNIRANPTAAAVLVQVLRLTEAMPLEDALDVESLAYATLQGGAEHRDWLSEHRAQATFQPTDDGPAVVLTRSGETLALELNRASNHNAMSVEMRDALNEALELALIDNSISRITIRGRGRCFSTGGDLTEFGTVADTATGHIVRSLSLPGRLLARMATRARVELHGACVGSGLEFPAFAAFVSARKNTHFQLPEIGMGLIPGAGGCISIARRIGRQRTAWLALSGKRIRAAQAQEWGLVDELLT